MRKKFYVNILISLICVNILGCGKIDNNNNDISKSSSVTSLPNINKDNNSSSENSYNTESPVILDTTSEPKSTDESNNKIRTETISSQRASYADASRTVKFLGLKEYSKIEGDIYTDTPKNGNKYLVLFLSIKNNTSEEDYINYNYLKSKVDGEKIKHTFLINEPRNYPTIFTKVYSGGNIAGFIVWEVPANWEKIEITYGGWKDIDNVLLKGKFTPKDLSNPIIYSANDYINTMQNY